MNTFCTFDGSLEHLVDEAVGSNRYKVTVRTQGGHSFGNFGNDNAIEKLAGIIEKLYQIKVPEGGKPLTTWVLFPVALLLIPLPRKLPCYMSSALTEK